MSPKTTHPNADHPRHYNKKIASPAALPEATYTNVAILIAGKDPPQWLPHHLQYWSTCLFRPEQQLTRVQVKNKLRKIHRLTATLEQELLELKVHDPTDHFLGFTAHIHHNLPHLIANVEKAIASDELSEKDGSTKLGRGKASRREGISAQGLCAVIVSETWNYFHNRYPRAKNVDAVNAVHCLWRASGHAAKRLETRPLTSWPRHFKNVQPQAQQLRGDIAKLIKDAQLLEAASSTRG